MSDGSGVDFGVPRSKPYSEHGREEYDRIFKLRDGPTVRCEPHKLETEGSIPSPAIFNPEFHEQMK